MIGMKVSYYTFLILFKRYMPTLYKHLNKEMFEPSMYITPWFMTLCSSNMPIQLTLRIWDIYFLEGNKILYRIAMAVLKLNEKELLNSSFEEMNIILNTFINEII